MKLHVHAWGRADLPPLVCVHGVTGHGERYKKLAEERWAGRFRVLAPDLRAHGRSGRAEPWDFETHVADLIETIDALGLEQPDWVGHSFGGRLLLELAAAHPDRVGRAVLLDPAIDVLPHVAEAAAAYEEADAVYASADDYADRRLDAPPRAFVLDDAALHCDVLPDGRLRRRTHQPAMASIYRELATPAPPPETLRARTLLVHAPAYGLVRDEHLAAYDGRVEVVAVPGMHMVMWDAFDDVAEAVERFLTT